MITKLGRDIRGNIKKLRGEMKANIRESIVYMCRNNKEVKYIREYINRMKGEWAKEKEDLTSKLKGMADRMEKNRIQFHNNRI